MSIIVVDIVKISTVNQYSPFINQVINSKKIPSANFLCQYLLMKLRYTW